MSTPQITIGINCYREGDWLLERWESVLRQTDERWVAVMILDGTNHKPTRDIFDMLSHPKLRKHAMSENLGPYATRTMAFELTDTPYHFCLDADDLLPVDAVARVLETFAWRPLAEWQTGGGPGPARSSWTMNPARLIATFQRSIDGVRILIRC